MHAPLVTRSGCRPPQTHTHREHKRGRERDTCAAQNEARRRQQQQQTGGKSMQCKLARAFYASLSSRALYLFHPLLFSPSHSLYIYTALWLHKSSLISISPPLQWRPLPPLAARPHLENCNFHAKLVHAAQLTSLPALRRQRRRRLRNLAQGQLATH